MKLKLRISKLEDVAEPVRGFYIPDGDGFKLDADTPDPDKDSKAKLDEFRASNRKLLAMLKDVGLDENTDPEKAKELKAALASLAEHEDGEDLRKGHIDKVIDRRTAKIRKELNDALAAEKLKATAAEQRSNTLGTKYTRLRIESAVRDHVNANTVPQQGAMPHILSTAHQAWRFDEEKEELYAVDEAGNKAFGKDGKAVTLDEWTQGLVKSNPFLFAASGGSGANKNGNRPSAGGGKTVVDADDPLELGRNVDKILSGEAIAR